MRITSSFFHSRGTKATGKIQVAAKITPFPLLIPSDPSVSSFSTFFQYQMKNPAIVLIIGKIVLSSATGGRRLRASGILK